MVAALVTGLVKLVLVRGSWSPSVLETAIPAVVSRSCGLNLCRMACASKTFFRVALAHPVSRFQTLVQRKRPLPGKSARGVGRLMLKRAGHPVGFPSGHSQFQGSFAPAGYCRDGFLHNLPDLRRGQPVILCRA